MAMPSIERLREVFSYNEISGLLTRKLGPKNKVIGSKVKRGETYYISIGVDGGRYLAHRIIYAIYHGVTPESIDHINGNGLDNRISNLRNVTHKENMRNARLSKSSKTGICGVSFDNKRSVYRAYITVDSKQVFLGYFDDLKDAAEARVEAEVKYGFHELHGTKK